jgi:hypothetical glycosyl hydrolase
MLNYNKGINEYENWIISEEGFDVNMLGKCETVFCLGNGYMGVRSATEERYLGETRDTFVAGTFNKFDEKEVTELPNVPDVIQMEFRLDEEHLNLNKMKTDAYCRSLNLKTGELTRTFKVTTEKDKNIDFVFKRIVSMDDLHVIAQKVEIIPEEDIVIKVTSGIDGTVTNSGFQHFSVRNKRFYDNKILQANYTTTQSKIDFSVNTAHILHVNGQEPVGAVPMLQMGSRTIKMDYVIELKGKDKFVLEKISGIYTARDLNFKEKDASEITGYAKKHLEDLLETGYDCLADNSARAWNNKVWELQDVKIQSEDAFDQLALRFALYHIAAMTPAHDNRMNIGAKGLTGEGYKGHTFWDTEIFILPVWICTNPKVARSLLEYRYYGLAGARKKAKENGYRGAMYPWESAWITDGEVTPKYGDADIVTGKELKIICGDIEQHITGDVAFGVWEYYQITSDDEFMELYGYEIIFDTAKFWASRLEWSDVRGLYEICDVIGPDEYSEHVNNNAYTNYLAYWNIKLAIEYYEKLKKERRELFAGLSDDLELEDSYAEWIQKEKFIYLPKENDELLVPQDDTYLTLPVIDLKKYKESASRADIIREYNMEQLSQLQVSKQADILVLFYIMEHLFTKEVKKINFDYYEDKCLHDSSLSLSMHAILANDIGKGEMSYEFFKRAAKIDLGEDMTSPKDGIHAASLGGIWQCAINGFAGVRLVGGKLRIEPKLPEEWKRIEFNLYWKSVKLNLIIDKEKISIKSDCRYNVIEFECFGKTYQVEDSMVIPITA